MKNNKLENGKSRREFIGDIAKGFGALAISSTLNLNLLANVPTNQTAEKFGFIIHGGAGTLEKSKMTPVLEKEYRAKLTEALKAGYNVIVKNGASLDAVETAIHILEDSPLFNAGKGAVFTAAGTNELDASIMDGNNLMAGAVGDVQHIKNPISLARLVMEKSPHVMMVGEGAETFAKQNGVNFVPQSYFRTEQRWQEYLEDKAADEKQKQKQPAKKAKAVSENYVTINDKHGTVGAAALDKMGNLAAGTSTGGLSYK
ncbi:MAG: isoaspartyl peptidase/L-asparaginase, partial [Acidobacteriota bacterium]